MQTVKAYYDELASDYDRSRFANSYGRHVDALERQILANWLTDIAAADVLDLGCGTGRLLDFAHTGVDQSAEMLKLAATKFPDRQLIQAAVEDLDTSLNRRFRAAICFHVFMHCEEALIARSLQALARVVEPGGCLVMDIPSQHRRALSRVRASVTPWHGSTAASRDDVARWAGPDWRIVRRRGILFLPVHRLPEFARSWFRSLDALIGRSALARYASYHVYLLERL